MGGHQRKKWFVIHTCNFVIFGASEGLPLVRQLMALGLGQASATSCRAAAGQPRRRGRRSGRIGRV